MSDATQICDKCGAYVRSDRIVMRRYLGLESQEKLMAHLDKLAKKRKPKEMRCHLIWSPKTWNSFADNVVCGPVREMNETEAWIARLEPSDR